MNDEAFAGLVRDYSRLIYTVCRRLVPDDQEAENLTQDTFLTAYRAIGRFQGEHYKPWLVRIAVNKAKDHLKSAGHALTEPAELETLDAYPSGRPAKSCPSPTVRWLSCGSWRTKVTRKSQRPSAGRSKRCRHRAFGPVKSCEGP